MIANRYKSQPVEVDEYFLAVVRYIHQNPLKAHMVEKLEAYPRSSYNEYANCNDGIADKEFIYEMMSLPEFKDFHQIDEENVFIVDDKLKVSDEGIKRDITKTYGYDPKSIAKLCKLERNEILSALKLKYSIRQIERVTGISRGIIANS